MKLNFWKPFIWGACVFGGLHLALTLYIFFFCDPEASLTVILLDLPLHAFGKKFFNRVLLHSNSFFLFYYIFFGSLMYAVVGGVLFKILNRIIKLVAKVFNLKYFLWGTTVLSLIFLTICIYLAQTNRGEIINLLFIGKCFLGGHLVFLTSLFNVLGYAVIGGLIISIIVGGIKLTSRTYV